MSTDSAKTGLLIQHYLILSARTALDSTLIYEKDCEVSLSEI